jgi:hypothetical protein
MPSEITPAEAVRIESLLARLDPDAAGACRVEGCVHLLHGPVEVPAGVPALAA